MARLSNSYIQLGPLLHSSYLLENLLGLKRYILKFSGFKLKSGSPFISHVPQSPSYLRILDFFFQFISLNSITHGITHLFYSWRYDPLVNVSESTSIYFQIQSIQGFCISHYYLPPLMLRCSLILFPFSHLASRHQVDQTVYPAIGSSFNPPLPVKHPIGIYLIQS